MNDICYELEYTTRTGFEGWTSNYSYTSDSLEFDTEEEVKEGITELLEECQANHETITSMYLTITTKLI